MRAVQTVRGRVDAFTALALRELSFDPNLAAADSDDDAMVDDGDDDGADGMVDDDDDDEGYADDFSDDEDLSWKVRRAAAGLVVALVRAYARRGARAVQCRAARARKAVQGARGERQARRLPRRA